MAPAIHGAFPTARDAGGGGAVVGIVMGLVSALAIGLVCFSTAMRERFGIAGEDGGHPRDLRATMPGWFAGLIPDRPEDMNEAVVQWLRTTRRRCGWRAPRRDDSCCTSWPGWCSAP
jgi:hypothetical protein